MRLIPWRRPEPPPRQARTIWSAEVGADGLRFSGAGLQAADSLLEDLAGLTSARISRRDALQATAVLRARNLIAGVSATLPIELRDAQRNIDERDWVGVQPNDLIEDTVTYANTYEDLLFEGTSYWRVTRRDAAGYPLQAEHLEHSAVGDGVGSATFPSRNISQDLRFPPDAPIFIDGVFVPSSEVIRFVSPHPPLLVHAAKAIRTLLLLDRTSSEYAVNPLPFGYFKDSEDAEDTMDDDQVREMLTKWEKARRERMWGYVESGLELNMLQWPTPQQLQLIQARNHAVLEIARATGLQPEDLATVVEGTSRTYQNAEDRRLDLVDFTLMPFLSAVQDRLSMNDITERGLRARYRVGAFARADTKSRMETYKTGIESGVLEPNEARYDEGRPDLPEEGNDVETAQAVARLIQQVYLGTDGKVVITAEEARDLLNRAGAKLTGELPEPKPASVPPPNGNGAIASNGNGNGRQPEEVT